MGPQKFRHFKKPNWVLHKDSLRSKLWLHFEWMGKQKGSTWGGAPSWDTSLSLTSGCLNPSAAGVPVTTVHSACTRITESWHLATITPCGCTLSPNSYIWVCSSPPPETHGHLSPMCRSSATCQSSESFAVFQECPHTAIWRIEKERRGCKQCYRS